MPWLRGNSKREGKLGGHRDLMRDDLYTENCVGCRSWCGTGFMDTLGCSVEAYHCS